MWHFKVPLWKAYLLLLFCGLTYSCGSAEYEINGKCCPMCAPGTRVYKHCTEYTSTSCVPCTQKSFIKVSNNLPHCFSCTVCEPAMGLKTERECTPTSDTVCGPLDHHYCTKTDNKGCSFAQKHTICRPGQFIRHNGTTSTNTECGYCPDKTFSNESFSAYCKPHRDCQSLGLQEITAGTNTSDSECGPRNIPVSIVILCLVSVLLASAVILAIIFILKRRKKKATDLPERERMNSASQPEDEGSGRQNMAADLTEREIMNSASQPEGEGSRRAEGRTWVPGRAGADPSMWARGRNTPCSGCQSIAGPSQHSLTQSCLKAVYHNLHVFDLWEETVSQGNPQ